jgi:hypothetical protein
MQARMAM